MFNSIAVRIADKLIEYNTINSDDRDIYEFGINQIFTTFLNLITVLIIGTLMHSIKESVFFFAAFIPLRIFAGGIHSKTPLRCYIYSSIIVVAVLLAMRYLSIPFLIYCLLYGMAGIIILAFSPVEDKNKPLDSLEKKVYRKRTIIVFTAESFILLIFYFAKIQFAVKSIMISTIALSLMILLGIIKNYLADSI